MRIVHVGPIVMVISNIKLVTYNHCITVMFKYNKNIQEL